MVTVTYDKQLTAVLVIDPYNDFISEGGKIWNRICAVAEANDCVPHMLRVLNIARKAKLRVFYAMHHRYRPGDYEAWKYIAPIQKAAWASKSFEYDTWGGEIRAGFEPKPDEIVATEHWCSSGFANTDLDLQLKKHGIHQLIVIGLIAHTCIEAPSALPPSSATRPPWSKTRRRITRMSGCMPPSTSISRTTPAPLSARRRSWLHSRLSSKPVEPPGFASMSRSRRQRSCHDRSHRTRKIDAHGLQGGGEIGLASGYATPPRDRTSEFFRTVSRNSGLPRRTTERSVVEGPS